MVFLSSALLAYTFSIIGVTTPVVVDGFLTEQELPPGPKTLPVRVRALDGTDDTLFPAQNVGVRSSDWLDSGWTLAHSADTQDLGTTRYAPRPTLSDRFPAAQMPEFAISEHLQTALAANFDNNDSVLSAPLPPPDPGEHARPPQPNTIRSSAGTTSGISFSVFPSSCASLCVRLSFVVVVRRK